MNDSTAKAIIAATARRDAAILRPPRRRMPVTREMFDEVMVRCYAPASFIPVRGEGSRVWDQDGRMYIDFAAGVAVTSLGHCHPALVRALTDQATDDLARVQPVYERAHAAPRAPARRPYVRRARVLLQFRRGTNEAALKLARRYAHDRFGEKKFRVVFHAERVPRAHAVHGHRRRPAKYASGFGPNPAGITHIPYNDVAALGAGIRQRAGNEICAVILEPMQAKAARRPERLRSCRPRGGYARSTTRS